MLGYHRRSRTKADQTVSSSRSGKQGSFGAPALEQDEEVTVQFLDEHAEVQWEVRPYMDRPLDVLAS